MLKKREGVSLFTAIATILILFSLITAYFWVHKPFDLPIVVGLSRTLSNIAVWLGLLWLATALGRLVGHLIGWSFEDRPLTHLILSCGLGLGLLSLIMLFLGLVGLLQPLVAWGLVLGLAGLLRGELTAVYQTLYQLQFTRPQTRFEKLLALYTVSTVSLTFLHALTPETSWDSLLYHLTGPELYIAAGRIHHNLDFALLGFPQLIELQYLLGMLLIGDGVAPLLHFSYGMMGFALATQLAYRTFGRETGWLTAVLLIATPALLYQLSDAYVDLALLYYATAVFTLFWQWRKTSQVSENPRSLVVLGVFCGLATSTKYTGAAIPLAVTANLLWASRQTGWRVIVKRLGIVTAVTIIITLPGLIENWLTTGNPVYPFLFDSPDWNPWRAWFYTQPHKGFLFTAPWQLLLAPLTATILGTTGTQAFGATIGPFILGGLLLLPFGWRSLKPNEKRLAKHLLIFVAITYLLWLAGMARSGQLQRTRLIMLPAFGLTAVLSALALSKLNSLSHPQLNITWLAKVVLSLTLLLISFDTLQYFINTNPLPVIIGGETANQYRLRQQGNYQAAINAINRLPADAKVQFLWEPRSYGCRSRCLPDVLLDKHYHAVRYQKQNATAIVQTWREQTITHVLINHQGWDFQNPESLGMSPQNDRAVLNQLIADHLAPIDSWGQSHTLYRLKNR